MKELNKKVIGIFSCPWRSYFSESNPLDIYRRAVYFKANPRSEDYMKSLFLQHYPEGLFVNADTDAQWDRHIFNAKEVVLLYPDSIGMGFYKNESKIFKYRAKDTLVHALNGRKRKFLLNNHALAQLYIRRLMERHMLGEVFITVIFLLLTPFFLTADIIRRRS